MWFELSRNSCSNIYITDRLLRVHFRSIIPTQTNNFCTCYILQKACNIKFFKVFLCQQSQFEKVKDQSPLCARTGKSDLGYLYMYIFCDPVFIAIKGLNFTMHRKHGVDFWEEGRWGWNMTSIRRSFCICRRPSIKISIAKELKHFPFLKDCCQNVCI